MSMLFSSSRKNGDVSSRYIYLCFITDGNKYVRSRITRTETYIGRVGCCRLVSHVEYAQRALLR